ncbi:MULTISPECIES: ABC transporter ATP-binding protein [unclassified Agarivorans]|uniref:ABC transporter ATP-binding protein n=1 Tax=unclassified Agarivorans TaxID=2636026 RepID=UPI0026E1A652|nr:MULTISPECIES: ABC transporter ATP-binding protein [unclassified Agarivorans]MDO6686473.1 ABC transporter ATP-binding protein [Agarivorans sp. 3_MG-2023]MDO6713775.1 ABC transporter ATP-binding protein [Agarivorans sp. 2_MG-2023]
MPTTESTSAPNIIINANGLNHHVATHAGNLSLLNDINLQIKQGESLAIVGASGSGKTTLLSILAGLDSASQGSVNLCGQNLESLDEEQRASLRRENVGFIFQQFLLVPALSALENVMLPAELKGVANARQLAEQWLEKVGLAERHDHYPNQLSGGEQQRVAIARAFISQPKVLFADEPSANLDNSNGQIIEDLLFELNQQSGTTLVLVTHELKLAERCARQITLQAGRIIKQ